MARSWLTSITLSSATLVVAFLVMRLILQACDVQPLANYLLGSCSDAFAVTQNDLAIALAERRSLESQIADRQRRLVQRECHAARAPSRGEDRPFIDAEAWEERDVSLLEGCWELDSDLRFIDHLTQELRAADAWTMCFDAAGNGSQNLLLDGVIACTSDEVSAAFDAAGDLIVRDNADVQCSDSSYIYERVITCALAGDGTAACESRQPETGSRSRLNLRR